MSDGRIRPGMPIPGSEGRISAASMAEALGLPTTPPPEPTAPPLSPAQARAKEEGKPLPESDSTYERITIRAGRDALETWGGSDAAADLPVGVESKLDPPRGKQHAAESAEPSPPPSSEETREALSAAAREAKRMLAEAKANGHGNDPATLSAGMRVAEKIARGLQRLNVGG